MTDTPTKLEQTHVSIILDRSGSMASCAAETIGAVNAYLAEARNDDALKEADLQLTIFDNQSIDTIRSGAPIALPDLTAQDFQPRGMTPLFDAIGRGIDSLDARQVKSGSSKAILVVMTDGQENSSHKYNHASISELIEARQDKGWLVIFLGKGLDVAQQGAALGVSLDTVASMDVDEQSLKNVAGATYSMCASYAAAASPQAFRATKRAAFSAEERTAMGDKSGGAGLAKPANPSTDGPIVRGKPGAQAADKPAAGDTWSNGSAASGRPGILRAHDALVKF